MPINLGNGAMLYTDVVHVTDTGLLWCCLVYGQSSDTEPKGCDYEEALDAAFTCRIGGHADWRLPTITEFVGLRNLILAYPPMEEIFTPMGRYWTSNDMEAKGSRREPAYYDTQYGSTSTQGRDHVAFVRLVRTAGNHYVEE